MSETELRVVCKSCGAEVSPYVTECPYCGTRVRKRAPKLERRNGGLEAKKSRREKRRERQAEKKVNYGSRPLATYAVILVPAIAMLMRIATGGDIDAFGALVVPFDSGWWRFVSAPFAYVSVGYLFAVSLAVVMFAPGLERRLGSFATLIMLMACGSLGMLAAYGVEEQRGVLEVIAGGNGMALGAIAAWYVVIRSETRDLDDEGPDVIGVLVCVAVILLLPVVVPSANVWSGLAGGAVGALAGLAATLVRR
ncbi:MAG: rhomboid family intramembrane serine protease [Solirubrobacterales bacterium]